MSFLYFVNNIGANIIYIFTLRQLGYPLMQRFNAKSVYFVFD
ncbi:hypothetical protein W822_22470 [Advenella kashmirensis W13003]|uniref:Uncharacterized protein n=1 Tax=Advenella kashmirensis W13003 TaxID=1424334 RepID=V8QNK6_9BURK|nr:hypothetical protein W822_22470 [Advenella kashmirensis W13003]